MQSRMQLRMEHRRACPKWSGLMDTVLLSAVLVCGLLTLFFILNTVRKLYLRAPKISVRALLVTTALSVLTAFLTLWQLADVLGQFKIAW
jgi:hypothetical protein